MVIHPMKYAEATCTSYTNTTENTTTNWEIYNIDPVEEELPFIEIKHIRSDVDRSKPCKLFNVTFIRRFRGNNKGRHWNRKDCHGKI